MEINYSSPLNMSHMNADVFNGLPKDLQQKVLDAAAKANDFAWAAAQKRVEQNYKDMKANGMTIVTDAAGRASRKPWPRRAQEAAEQWLKKMGPEGKKILDAYYEKIGK